MAIPALDDMEAIRAAERRSLERLNQRSPSGGSGSGTTRPGRIDFNSREFMLKEAAANRARTPGIASPPRAAAPPSAPPPAAPPPAGASAAPQPPKPSGPGRMERAKATVQKARGAATAKIPLGGIAAGVTSRVPLLQAGYGMYQDSQDPQRIHDRSDGTGTMTDIPVAFGNELASAATFGFVSPEEMNTYTAQLRGTAPSVELTPGAQRQMQQYTDAPASSPRGVRELRAVRTPAAAAPQPRAATEAPAIDAPPAGGPAAIRRDGNTYSNLPDAKGTVVTPTPVNTVPPGVAGAEIARQRARDSGIAGQQAAPSIAAAPQSRDPNASFNSIMRRRVLSQQKAQSQMLQSQRGRAFDTLYRAAQGLDGVSAKARREAITALANPQLYQGGDLQAPPQLDDPRAKLLESTSAAQLRAAQARREGVTADGQELANQQQRQMSEIFQSIAALPPQERRAAIDSVLAMQGKNPNEGRYITLKRSVAGEGPMAEPLEQEYLFDTVLGQEVGGAGAQPAQQPSGDDQFTVGGLYRDAQNRVRKYLGNGQFGPE